jgi:hypothetical protein
MGWNDLDAAAARHPVLRGVKPGAHMYFVHSYRFRRQADPTTFPGVAAVILYPAIDLKDGQCVRLLRGDMAPPRCSTTDPADQARAFATAGFEWLHRGRSQRRGRRPAGQRRGGRGDPARVSMPVQLGGGIRTWPPSRLARGAASAA